MNSWQALRNSTAGLLALVISAIPLTGMAETVQIPIGQQGSAGQTIVRPTAGMKQSAVEARFGKPIDWTDPVGDPPISSWVYPEFVVYFEYDEVLHSVVKHTPQNDQQESND